VDKPDPDSNAPEQYEAEVADRSLVVPSGYPAVFFQFSEEALDASAQRLWPFIDVVLRFAVALGGDFRSSAAVP
jgi:hypothetical protein